MDRFFQATRWILAFCAATCMYLIVFMLVQWATKIAFHDLQINTGSNSFAAGFIHIIPMSLATLAGIWAGASTMPLEYRKVCILTLGATLVALVFVSCVSDFVTHNFGSDDIADIGGTLAGFYRVWSRLWRRLDKQIEELDNNAPPRLQKQIPDFPQKRVPDPVKNIAASRASFGRRR